MPNGLDGKSFPVDRLAGSRQSGRLAYENKSFKKASCIIICDYKDCFIRTNVILVMTMLY